MDSAHLRCKSIGTCDAPPCLCVCGSCCLDGSLSYKIILYVQMYNCYHTLTKDQNFKNLSQIRFSNLIILGFKSYLLCGFLFLFFMDKILFCTFFMDYEALKINFIWIL